jgi:N6-adenosine-specific RNA methylase IME4
MDYKATLVWNKEKIGMGAWFRMQCEFCLVGIKGKPYWENTTFRDIFKRTKKRAFKKA